MHRICDFECSSETYVDLHRFYITTKESHQISLDIFIIKFK